MLISVSPIVSNITKYVIKWIYTSNYCRLLHFFLGSPFAHTDIRQTNTSNASVSFHIRYDPFTKHTDHLFVLINFFYFLKSTFLIFTHHFQRKKQHLSFHPHFTLAKFDLSDYQNLSVCVVHVVSLSLYMNKKTYFGKTSSLFLV